ncbi:MAG: hypothetical protein E7415_01510 [Ruminococcaceae bacterium]|nr:hypothetical protein [Oscillospiraceae bacterium]
MKKKIIIGVIMVGVAVLSFTAGVFGKHLYDNRKIQTRSDITVKIDGEEKVFKDFNGGRVYPILCEGTTYLPVRTIGEILGKNVYWNENEKVIEFKGGAEVKEQEIVVSTGDEQAKPNNSEPDMVGYISKEKAKEIALNKAGLGENDVTFIKVELERDDGIYIYDVEFRQGRMEYNAEIKADNGKIIDWDAEIDD